MTLCAWVFLSTGLSFKKLGTMVERVGSGTILYGFGFWFYRD